jgi:hypothetical protein
MLFVGIKENGNYKYFTAKDYKEAKYKSKLFQCILIGKLIADIPEETLFLCES